MLSRSEQTKRGLERAVRFGRKLGRKPVVSDNDIKAVMHLGTKAAARAVRLSKVQYIKRRKRIENAEAGQPRPTADLRAAITRTITQAGEPRDAADLTAEVARITDMIAAYAKRGEANRTWKTGLEVLQEKRRALVAQRERINGNG